MRQFAKMLAKKASNLQKMIDTPASKESLSPGGVHYNGNKIAKFERTPQKDTIEHRHNPIVKQMAGKLKGKGEAKSGKYAGMNAIEKAQFKGAERAKKSSSSTTPEEKKETMWEKHRLNPPKYPQEKKAKQTSLSNKKWGKSDLDKFDPKFRRALLNTGGRNDQPTQEDMNK